MVVICSWFEFNFITITHLFELKFEFACSPIVNHNKLRLQITCQPGVIKQILDECCWFICGFDSFKPTCGVLLVLSLWVKTESVFFMVSLLEMEGTHQMHTYHDPGSDSNILGGSSPFFLRLCWLIIIWLTWQMEYKQSIFKVLCKTRLCDGIPDSFFCSCLSRVK
jgi:hypothetical protein